MGLLNGVTAEHDLSVILMVLTAAILAGYLIWNFAVKQRRIQRVVAADKALYLSNPKKYHDELMNVFSTTPQVVAEVASLSVASVILGITLLWKFTPGSFEYNICSLAVALLSLGSISYLFAMEQLTTIISPSVVKAERFRLYEEAINLKVIGFFGMWSSVLVLLMLSNVYAVAAGCIFTTVLFIRHFDARWVRPHEKELIYME